MSYPGSSPEFRILIKQDGTQTFQVRYTKYDIGYVSKWTDIPVVIEHNTANKGTI